MERQRDGETERGEGEGTKDVDTINTEMCMIIPFIHVKILSLQNTWNLN